MEEFIASMVFSIPLGLIPAFIAQDKGRSFVTWWVYGALIFIVAFPHSVIIKANHKIVKSEQLFESMKKCQFFVETIKQDAIVCRYCGRDLPQDSPNNQRSLQSNTV